MPTPRPIVTALDHRTGDMDITGTRLAQMIGVRPSTVSVWRAGKSVPSFVHLVGWAEQIGYQVAAVDKRGQVHAVGADIGDGLAKLREQAGLTQRQLGARRRVAQPSIAQFEARGRNVGLPAMEAHLAALGLRLTLMPATQMREVAA